MSPLTDAIAAVSQRLDTFLESRSEESAHWGVEAADFAATAAAAVQGGKRLRARFCLAGWLAASSADARPGADVVATAAALEIFQAAALVHDDIIDNSDTRRGRPATHRSLESHHRRRGWAGDAAAFGRAGAVLAGDLLVAWSDDLLEEGLTLSPPRLASSARAEYARMRRDVTTGQFLDIAEESAFAVEPDERHAERALRVAAVKSARYSVEQPLRIGAAVGGASEPDRDALSAFGHPVGMAFQLRDDVLGVFGDERETGKPAGDDLREGKRTVLIAYTREALPPAERRSLDRLIGDPALDADQIAALQRTIAETGALERVEALIAEFAADADRALGEARLTDAALTELRALADAATSRIS